MQDIVLYCKSYHRDLLRVVRLLDGIERHHVEHLPVCISTARFGAEYGIV